VPRAALAPASPLPRLALAAPALSTSRRRRLSCHDFCQPPAPAPTRPRFLLDPDHILELPTHSFLPSRDYISTTFSSPEHHPSPDLRHSLGSPSSAAHTTSEPRSSAVRASPTHWCSPAQPISFSRAQTSSPAAPVSSKLRRRSASPSTRRYRASSPQSRAPAAPHQPVEASWQLLHCPTTP
jgi:hypothetical protein